MTFVIWTLLIAAIVLIGIGAKRVTGRTSAAVLACIALACGYFPSIHPSVLDAALLIVAALALEQATAIRATHPWAAIGLSLLPALGFWCVYPGVPTSARVLDVLFCTEHGFLATSALLWCGAAGIVWQSLRRGSRDRWIALSLGVVVLAIASGHRTDESWREAIGRATIAVPFLGFGLACLFANLTALAARRPIRTVAATLGVLVLWNLTLMATADAGTLRIGEIVSFGDIGAAQARVLHDWIGHPWSSPETLWFALRNRTTLARFDAVMSTHVSDTRGAIIDIGAVDDAFVVDGWYAKEHTSTTTFRWAQQRATLLLPPLPAGQVKLRIRAQPFAFSGATAQTVNLQLGSEDCGRLTLAPGWQWLEWTVPANLLGAGPIKAVLTFDHVTRPVDVGGGNDQRLMSAAVDAIELRTDR